MKMLRRALEDENDNVLNVEDMSEEEWVAFDLDGTAAVYNGWNGIEHIGEPIARTIAMIKAFLGKGVKVKFLTARVACADPTERRLARKYIADWSLEHIGTALEATCIKDRFMVRQYDDRARQVVENTGELVLNNR